MRDPSSAVGKRWALSRLRYTLSKSMDAIIEHDVILLWGESKRVITGTDVLGRDTRGG
jgi:hypothetical protein